MGSKIRGSEEVSDTMAAVNVTVVKTKVFPGQKPGTSGLRKRVEEFMQEHYMENFIQCTLDALGNDLKGSTLVVGGDGRYGVTQATDKVIKTYKICNDLNCDFSQVGTSIFSVKGKEFKVDVIDSIDDYVDMMKGIFDFDMIKEHLKGIRILLNSLHGVTGPYVERIFGTELGAPQESFMKTNILPDFGGGHPDPNLTYAEDLVKAMSAGQHAFGAAFDGDGDRNMILGPKAFFVTPCDSLAVIANNLEIIPYFQKNPANGYARSMPTSAALDRVAAAKGKECFETPTGWKFFGNLLDAGRISLCGEESFGTGSDHIREKDGIWAALAWLQILASQKISVEDVLTNHWMVYGRNFFTRYDYENCQGEPCNAMMAELQAFVDNPGNIGKVFTASSNGKTFEVSKADNFQYVDPIDKSVTKNQGIRVFFTDGSRFVMRLSGTGSSGATVRLYVDTYEAEKDKMTKNAAEMLAPCIEVALQISKLPSYTGRNAPTVIT